MAGLWAWRFDTMRSCWVPLCQIMYRTPLGGSSILLEFGMHASVCSMWVCIAFWMCQCQIAPYASFNQNESHSADNTFHEHSSTQMLMMLPTAFDHNSSFVVSFDYIPIKFIIVGINFKCVCGYIVFGLLMSASDQVQPSSMQASLCQDMIVSRQSSLLRTVAMTLPACVPAAS